MCSLRQIGQHGGTGREAGDCRLPTAVLNGGQSWYGFSLEFSLLVTECTWETTWGRCWACEISASLAPVRERRRGLVAHPDDVRDVLRDGARRARPLAQATMDEVRRAMGMEEMKNVE